MDNETPIAVLNDIKGRASLAIRACSHDDYRRVNDLLDDIRERCSWVEKMVWRRIQTEKEKGEKRE